MTTTTSPPPSLVSVYSGRECIGFVLKRANGFEAYTAAERSLGIFPNMKAAADTVSANAREESAPAPDISTQIADAFAGLRHDVRNRLRGRS